MIAAGVPLDAFTDLLGPGLVFLLLAFWLVRKAFRAARTERQLEGEQGETLRSYQPAPPARPHLVPVQAAPALAGADLSHARAEHVAAVAALLAEGPAHALEVLWVRSLGAHVAWLEQLPAGEQALHVVRFEGGQLAERWTFPSGK